jgi:hypothetical protein
MKQIPRMFSAYTLKKHRETARCNHNQAHYPEAPLIRNLRPERLREGLRSHVPPACPARSNFACRSRPPPHQAIKVHQR